MHNEPPFRSAIDRQIQRASSAERARQLAHAGMHVANVIDAVLDDGEVVMPALARQRLHRSLAIVHGRVTERCERRWWRSTFEGIDGHAFRGREERCDADRSTPDL